MLKYNKIQWKETSGVWVSWRSCRQMDEGKDGSQTVVNHHWTVWFKHTASCAELCALHVTAVACGCGWMSQAWEDQSVCFLHGWSSRGFSSAWPQSKLKWNKLLQFPDDWLSPRATFINFYEPLSRTQRIVCCDVEIFGCINCLSTKPAPSYGGLRTSGWRVFMPQRYLWSAAGV